MGSGTGVASHQHTGRAQSLGMMQHEEGRAQETWVVGDIVSASGAAPEANPVTRSPQTLTGQADERWNFLICNQKIPTDTDLEKEHELGGGSHVSYMLV